MAADAGGGPNPYLDFAEPVFEFVETVETAARRGERRLAEEAEAALSAYETALDRAEVPRSSLKPARYALAVLIDHRVRTVPHVRLVTWTILAGKSLFEGHEITSARLQEFRDTASRQGEAYAPLTTFLDEVLRRLEARRRGRPKAGTRWGIAMAAAAVALVLALCLYAGILEYRFQSALWTTFLAEAGTIDPAGAAAEGRLGPALDDLDAATARVSAAAAGAPFRGRFKLPFADAFTRSRARYVEVVNAELPAASGAAIEEKLAVEGTGLGIYDALRAWSVLTGEVNWAPGYLAGWLEDNRPKLARHVAALDGPRPGLGASDPELMKLVRGFAAEASEPERAWLELLRADSTRELPRWRPGEEVPDLGLVLTRRDGAPLGAGLSGLYTAAGWQNARNFGIGVAVQKAREVGPAVTGETLKPRNDTPDLVEARLLDETLEAWKDWLAELRVRPFVNRETALIVSGALGQPQNPLTGLLQEVWIQVGGGDRRRRHAQQLRIATEFGPMIQYVEEGRMAEISRLFAALNVAFGALDVDDRRGNERLMTLQDRIRSVNALKAAPRVVVQITEDVLAQSSLPSHEAITSNPLTRQWQRQVFPLCVDALNGRYPFSEGPDAEEAQLAILLGPAGVLPDFVFGAAEPFLDTGESPWRWKPEARFAGLDPDSAAFLERAMTASAALFDASGRMQAELTLAALAERGETIFTIGGASAPVRATGDPALLSWPGAAPQAGVEVRFRSGTNVARMVHDGTFGLIRLLDGLRLRLRDGGKRVLVDLRSEAGRIFVELSFSREVNPVSARSVLEGLACPPAL